MSQTVNEESVEKHRGTLYHRSEGTHVESTNYAERSPYFVRKYSEGTHLPQNANDASTEEAKRNCASSNLKVPAWHKSATEYE